jgi:hypothetical protein
LSDNTNQNTSYDKISFFTTYLSGKWCEIYYPSLKLAVDETLIPFRGRSKFIQYMPQKPHKWGLKMWSIADSTNGYMLNVNLYRGENTCNEQNISYNCVMKLLERCYLEKVHYLYMDSYFSSPKLFEDLIKQNIFSIGMIRNNRKGLLSKFKTLELEHNESVTYQKGNLMYMAWKDKKNITLLSTIKNNQTHDVSIRTNSENTLIKVKPNLISDYSSFMKAVDRNNQMCSYYSIPIKSFKWWKPILYRLVEISIVNAFILFRMVCNQTISHKDFRLFIIEKLLDEFHFVKLYGKDLLNQNGVSVNFLTTEDKKKRTCNLCSKYKIRTQTYYYCEICFQVEGKIISVCGKCQDDHIKAHNIFAK